MWASNNWVRPTRVTAPRGSLIALPLSRCRALPSLGLGCVTQVRDTIRAMGCNVSTAQGQVQQHAQLDSSGSKCRAAPLRSDLRSKETASSVDSAFEVGVGGRAAPAQSITVPRSVSVRGTRLATFHASRCMRGLDCGVRFTASTAAMCPEAFAKTAN